MSKESVDATESVKPARDDSFADLLQHFAAATARVEAAARLDVASDQRLFDTLLGEFHGARERHRLQQRTRADDFNILKVLDVIHQETRHSMVLAWLLDHRLEVYGTHAQGRLGFELFLAELKLPLQYAGENYWVRRERRNEESIIDVEVAAPGKFLIHIENKIWAAEGVDQTDREWADIQRCAREINISPSEPGAAIHALFLTPNGVRPANEHFRPISWQQICRVLEQFAAKAEAPEVRLFAEHYAVGIRTFVASQIEAQDGETDVE